MNNSLELLDALHKINKENSVDIFVPSLNKKVKFKPLNIKQQKDLIKTTLAGATSTALFSQVLNNIIISNAEELNTFKIYDRYAIALGLRAYTINDTYKYKNESVNLIKFIDKSIKKFQQCNISNTQELNYHTIKISLKIPTLDRDILVTEKFINDNKYIKHTNYSDIIGDLYIYEVVKFIESIQVGEGDTFNFADLPIENCVAIVENLPVNLNTQIIDYIQTVRSAENIFVELENGSIEINTSFFTRA
jgi:hypothetical protein